MIKHQENNSITIANNLKNKINFDGSVRLPKTFEIATYEK